MSYCSEITLIEGMIGRNNTTEPRSPTFYYLTFPQRVHCILHSVECNNQEHITSWVNQGTAFKVHDPNEFERDLLPRHFNMEKYASFTRALYAHGFKCERTGRQTGIYSHPYFIRKSAENLHLIKRTKNNKNHAKVAITNRFGFGLNNRLPVQRDGLRREGQGPTFSSSLLDNKRTSRNTESSGSVFGQLSSTATQVAPDRTTHLSTWSQLLANPTEPSTNPSRPLLFPPPSVRSIWSSNISAASSNNVVDQHLVDHHEAGVPIPHNYPRSILDDQQVIQPISLGSMIADSTQDDQKHTTAEIPLIETHQHPPDPPETVVGLISFFNGISMEPRSIQEMKQRPDMI